MDAIELALERWQKLDAAIDKEIKKGELDAAERILWRMIAHADQLKAMIEDEIKRIENE